MEITEKIYSFMKTSKVNNGFVPTIKQIAEEFNIADHEVKLVIEQLEKSGRIKITDIPRKTTIEFAD